MKKTPKQIREAQHAFKAAVDAERERKAVLDLGWAHWSRLYSQCRGTASDASKPLEVRQQAHRALDGYLKACLMCGFKPADLESPAEREARQKANEVSGF